MRLIAIRKLGCQPKIIPKARLIFSYNQNDEKKYSSIMLVSKIQLLAACPHQARRKGRMVQGSSISDSLPQRKYVAALVTTSNINIIIIGIEEKDDPNSSPAIGRAQRSVSEPPPQRKRPTRSTRIIQSITNNEIRVPLANAVSSTAPGPILTVLTEAKREIALSSPSARPPARSPPTTPIMSGRKLGGGRVLGSGKGLAPPITSSSHRVPSPYAPSDSSSVSQYSNSQQSISPPSSSAVPDFGPQDLVSRISIGAPSTGDAASTRLVCPICDDEMVWLHFHLLTVYKRQIR